MTFEEWFEKTQDAGAIAHNIQYLMKEAWQAGRQSMKYEWDKETRPVIKRKHYGAQNNGGRE